jgi:hypothetical protein
MWVLCIIVLMFSCPVYMSAGEWLIDARSYGGGGVRARVAYIQAVIVLVFLVVLRCRGV